MFLRRYFLALLTLLTAMAPISNALPIERKVGELRVDVFSYVGNMSTSEAQMVRYRILDHQYPIKESKGFIKGETYTPYSLYADEFSRDPIMRGFIFPEAVGCNDLLHEQERISLKAMQNNGTMTAEDAVRAAEITRQLHPDQISFIEVKMFDVAKTDPKGTYDLDQSEQDQDHLLGMISRLPGMNALNGRFVNDPKKFWKRVGTIRVVAGQVDGKRLPLPFQLENNPAIPPIPTSMKAVFEYGRLVKTDDIDIDKVMPAAIQRTRKELVALNLEEKDGWIFGHAVTAAHITHYLRWGFKVFWMNDKKTEAVLVAHLPDLLPRFSPAKLGFESLDIFKQLLPYREVYEAYATAHGVTGPVGSQRAHVRFFAQAMREGVSVPSSIDQYNLFHTFAYRPDEVVQLRNSFPMGFIGNPYAIVRDTYSAVFNLHQYYVDHDIIELDLPFRDYRMTFNTLFSSVGMVGESIEKLLRSRDIQNPIEWLKEKKIKIAFLTRDVELMQVIQGIPAGNEIGASLKILQRELPPDPQTGLLRASALNHTPTTALILFDLSTFLTAFHDPTKVTRTVTGFEFDRTETSLRVEPDLD